MANEQPKEDVIITRIVAAPVELVWKAWTVPEYVKRWWGPKYFTAPFARVDLREGGSFLFAMQAPPEQGGAIQYSSGTYTKIVQYEVLEFIQGLSDEHGNRIDPSSIGMPPDFPYEQKMQVKFRAIKPDMTELVITEFGWTPGQMMIFAYAGLQQSIDKLADSLGK